MGQVFCSYYCVFCMGPSWPCAQRVRIWEYSWVFHANWKTI